MHELSIAISMVEEVVRILQQRGGDADVSVSKVHLKLGALSGVDCEALRFCYKAACEDTELDGSELVVEATPIVVHCAACMAETSPPSMQELSCSRCFAAGQVIQGHELEISAIEVMDERVSATD